MDVRSNFESIMPMIQLQSKKRSISHFSCDVLECFAILNREFQDIRLGQFPFGFVRSEFRQKGFSMRESALAQLLEWLHFDARR